MIENGADLTLENKEKQTPFTLALKHEKINILSILSEKVEISQNPQLLHKFSDKVFQKRYRDILRQLLGREKANNKLSGEVMNTLAENGFTPFLAYIQSLINHMDTLKVNVTEEVMYFYYQHKLLSNSSYEITNTSLFKEKRNKDKEYHTWRNNNMLSEFVTPQEQ